jgi:hypothetical protein
VPEVRAGSAVRERCGGRLDTPDIPAINSLRVGLSVDSGRAASSNGHQSRVSYFLSSLPLSLSILLLVVIPTAIAMGAQALVHRWVGVEKLVQNNEIAGFKFATVGVIYAVLLAFTVIVVWEKFSAAENAVDQEAASIAALLRYAEGKEPAALALRQSVTAYAKTVIEDEWPAMEKESESPAATRALDAVYDAALALGRAGTRETADMAEVFAQTDNITASRRIRLHLATGLVPPIIWAALFAGALLTVGFTLFFGSENLLAQIAMTGVLSTLVTLGLMVIVSIDHPFTGAVSVHPDPIVNVLTEFDTR